MRPFFIRRTAVLAALLCAAVAPLRAEAGDRQGPPPTHRLFQFSVLDAFLSGVYDGDLTVAELKQNGDFGLGSFNGGDGELIALGGTVYQVRADGVARVMPGTAKVPFAVVHRWATTRVLSRPEPTTKADLERWIDARLPTPNGIYGVKITARVRALTARAIPTTDKRPYPPLSALIPTQSLFRFADVTGTFIGYRLPPYLKGLNVPGYHFHFLTADRRAGGHVLEYEIADARVEIDEIRDFVLRVPTDTAFAAADLDKDRRDETKTVEQGKSGVVR